MPARIISGPICDPNTFEPIMEADVRVKYCAELPYDAAMDDVIPDEWYAKLGKDLIRAISKAQQQKIDWDNTYGDQGP